MSRTQRYKKIEKRFATNVQNKFLAILKAIKNFFIRVFKIFDSKLTIMIVPHSQGKVINFQTNVFALVLGCVLIVGIVSSFLYFNRKAISSKMEIDSLANRNHETLASLDELRDENTTLLQVANRFRSTLSQSLSLLGLNESGSASGTSSNSDLSSIFGSREAVHGISSETADIRELTTYLENTVEPIEQIGKMIENQKTLFKEIPNIWPVKNKKVHISQLFGPTTHAITGQWYIHKGIDFSTWSSGDPIMATANGQVVFVGYDPSFGNNVVIRHKHGMYTRYAQMRNSIVKKGESVSQGQTIGYIGNTGVSTGPHLHYEVHIGSDVVDPIKYINVMISK